MAAEALSEGPSCVLSAVANRHDKRMVYTGRAPDPQHEDSTVFLRRLQRALAARGLARKGLTTDGSARSPGPIREVCGEVPHPRCPFHSIKDLTTGVLRAVAAERARFATSQPTLQRGRRSSKEQAARRLARTSKQRQQKIGDVFPSRVLCVTRHVTPSEHHRLLRITRGLPPWRTWREIMEHICAVCERRCRTQTGLQKLHKLRHGVQRCTWIGETLQKVFAPRRETALTFLDDTLLPATSHAVERGNRRHRKRQKRVDRVRSKPC